MRVLCEQSRESVARRMLPISAKELFCLAVGSIGPSLGISDMRVKKCTKVIGFEFRDLNSVFCVQGKNSEPECRQIPVILFFQD